jgi:hypothetical protein
MNYPPYEDPQLPLAPSAEDLNNFSAPVAEIPQPEPLPPPQSKGVGFDYSVLSAATQEEFDAKPKALKKLIHEFFPNGKIQGVLPSQEVLANRLMEIQKMETEQSTPKAQAEMANTQLDVATKKAALDSTAKASKEDAQRTYQRASNMVWLINNIRGGKRGEVAEENEKWRSRVGTVEGRWPSLLSSGETLGWAADYESLKGMINLDEAQRNRGQGSLTEGERVLMAQAASLGLDRVRDEKGFKAALERMYDFATEAQQANMKKLSGADKFDSPATTDNAATAPQASTPPPPPQFKSREDVAQAVNTGQLSREQATAILRTQFSNEFR